MAMTGTPDFDNQPTMAALLHAEKLTKRFNHFCAVDQIDFEIGRGECFGFLGPNGAGKTTTIKMIYGAFDATQGSLNLFGLGFEKHKREIKQKIGVVPQKDILEESLSAIDNLRIHGKHFGFDKKTIAEKSERLLKLLQLANRSQEPVFRFSGGMKRRLSIAKGLLNDPELLLLDEPTTGLDPQSRYLMWEKLCEIKSSGKTILLTTHYMQEAEILCDEIVIMDHGKIIERGRPKDLIQKHGGQNLEEVFLKLTGRELRD